MSESSSPRGKYLHYKGKYYDVLGEARDMRTLEEYIVYRQGYGRKHWWIRPKKMFFEKIFREGEIQFRFTKLEDRVDLPASKDRVFIVRHTETGDKYFARYKHFFGKEYLLSLESERGEQLCFELNSTGPFSSERTS